MARKAAKPPGRGSDQFVIRFPEGMRDRLAKLAAANGRSMNAELVHRLETTMTENGILKYAEVEMEKIKAEIAQYMAGSKFFRFGIQTLNALI
jgi:predicted DNA-binding protein